MNHCGQPTHSDLPCRYPADRCPVHASRPQLDREKEPAFDARDPHALGRFAVERAASSSANPLQTARFMRAVTQLHGLGEAPMDYELALRETSLRGLIMNGEPPRNAEEWELARSIFAPDAIEEFEHWDRMHKALEPNLTEIYETYFADRRIAAGLPPVPLFEANDTQTKS